MAYSHSIASMAKTFPWPSWIMHDQALKRRQHIYQSGYGERRMPAGMPSVSLYAKCFNCGPMMIMHNWCWNCQSLEHQTDQYPHKLPATKLAGRDGLRPEDPSKKFNSNDGMCNYEISLHSSAFLSGGSHPYSRCSEKIKPESERTNSCWTFSCMVCTTI